MAQVKVYVVGFESRGNFGTSFWDWYPTEKNAKTRKEQLEVDKQLQNNGILYIGSLMVDNSQDEGYITAQVENFLEEGNWEKSFI